MVSMLKNRKILLHMAPGGAHDATNTPERGKDTDYRA